VPPKDSYIDRVFIQPGLPASKVARILQIAANGQPKDFSIIIEHAKKCAAPTEIETGEIVGGFAHNQVMALGR
jgi:hydroxylamine reductase